MRETAAATRHLEEAVLGAHWLPALAHTLGAKKPRRVPCFVGRMFAGDVGAVFMTEIRGGSDAKVKRGLAWSPEHSSWRQGFAAA
jgi:hypothetical protein